MNKPQLEFPEIDAKELADIFRKAGYAVDLLLGKEATQGAIKAKLKELKLKGDSDGVVVTGFFGHGIEFDKTKLACFCPFDTTMRDVVDSAGRKLPTDDGNVRIEPDPDSLVTMEDILAGLRLSPAGNRILLADCCRNDPNKARGRAFGANLRIADLPRNTATLFACSENERAFEHRDWGHGAFTKCLIDELMTRPASGRITANQLSVVLEAKVKKLVASNSAGQNRQTVSPLVNGIVDFKMPSLIRAFEGTVAGETRQDNGLNLKFAWCPPGKHDLHLNLRVGLHSEDVSFPPPKDYPDYSATIEFRNGFWISQQKVTKADFELVCKRKLDIDPSIMLQLRPIPAMLSWADAQQFARDLSEQERAAGRLQDNECYSLPAYAEWQYALRAGSNAKYFWGDDKSLAAKYVPFTDIEDASAVTPTTWGLQLMAGVSHEWCRDWLPKANFGPSSKAIVIPDDLAYRDRQMLQFRILAGFEHHKRSEFEKVEDWNRFSEEQWSGYSIAGGAVGAPYFTFRLVRRLLSVE